LQHSCSGYSHQTLQLCESLFYDIDLISYVCTWINTLIFSLYQQDIAAVANEAARKYKEDTAPDALIEGGPTTAMLEAVKVKTQNLVSRLSKLTAVANPVLGPEFLEDV
jgi:hypothetical protein